MDNGKPDQRKFTLRVPDDLYEAVKAVADKEERSLHAQVIWCLRQCPAVVDELKAREH